MGHLRLNFRLSLAALVLGVVAVGSATAQGAADFTGKRLKFIIGFGVGGGYDVTGRMMARHMGRHLPGKPKFIVQNMPGAGSVRAANFIYTRAPKDGTVMGLVGRGIMYDQLLETRRKVKFDATRFTFLGNLEQSLTYFVVNKQSGIKTWRDLDKPGVVLGANAGDSEMFTLAIQNLLKPNMRVVVGYPGSADLALAVDRNEVQGMIMGYIALNQQTRPEWVSRDGAIPILGLTNGNYDQIKPLAIVEDLIKDPRDRKAYQLITARQKVGRPVLAPPDLPADIAKVLQTAFVATMKDPKFLADAKKQKISITWMDGPSSKAWILKTLNGIGKNKAVVKRAIWATKKHNVERIKLKRFKGTIAKIQRKGRRVSLILDVGGKKVRTKLHRTTRVKVNGERVRRRAHKKLKVGMTCRVGAASSGTAVTLSCSSAK